MLQILVLAPSMRPDIEPVVSSAKTRSTRGRGAAATGPGAAGASGPTRGAAAAGLGADVAAGAAARAARCRCWAATAPTLASSAPIVTPAASHLFRRASIISLIVFGVVIVSCLRSNKTHHPATGSRFLSETRFAAHTDLLKPLAGAAELELGSTRRACRFLT